MSQLLTFENRHKIMKEKREKKRRKEQERQEPGAENQGILRTRGGGGGGGGRERQELVTHAAQIGLRMLETSSTELCQTEGCLACRRACGLAGREGGRRAGGTGA